MEAKEKVLFSLVILLMFSLFLFILFGDKGLMELNYLKTERDLLIRKNEILNQENLMLYRRIERLKNDPGYIESVARKEYGMVKENEVVVKMKKNGKPSQ